MIAAAVVPLLAMVGGGVDMGRSYLSQTRLQQACDAGVLAARKRMGTQVVVDGIVPEEVAEVGERYFDMNFRTGAYGSKDRAFQMTVEPDLSISGEASVNVPTSVMHIFGNDNVPVQVACEARLAVSNTDIMLVLDTTGSMATVNPGDSASRIDVMRDVVSGFHAQMEASKSPGTRIRYGFVPYSTNVNVGHLLRNEWVSQRWSYDGRESIVTGTALGTTTYERNWQYASGSRQEMVTESIYDATYHPPGGGGYTYVDANENVVVVPPGRAYYSCDTAPPADTFTQSDVLVSSASEPFAGPPVGTREIQYRKRTRNGTDYWLSLNGTRCSILKSTFVNYVETYERVTDPVEREVRKWRYASLPHTFTNWRWETNGCIEERETYEVTDTDVDIDRALDLNLDLVPTADDATKWKPARPWGIFARSKAWDRSGSFTPQPRVTTSEYINPNWIGLAACPAPARLLSEMSAAELTGYLATLYPTGQTYHDIGMIWGGRLINKAGLFAAQNVDVSGRPTNRHLIFLTDGETAPMDLVYGAYGVEPLTRRRWSETSSLTLQETVELRFQIACNEVRNRNVTVWVIGFGTEMTPVMQQCAGAGHWFQADDAEELNDIFGTIARTIGELRISR